MHPDLDRKVHAKQIRNKTRHDTKLHEFKIGNNVYFKNFHKGDQWLQEVIYQVNGPVSYVVKLTDG